MYFIKGVKVKSTPKKQKWFYKFYLDFINTDDTQELKEYINTIFTWIVYLLNLFRVLYKFFIQFQNKDQKFKTILLLLFILDFTENNPSLDSDNTSQNNNNNSFNVDILREAPKRIYDRFKRYEYILDLGITHNLGSFLPNLLKVKKDVDNFYCSIMYPIFDSYNANDWHSVYLKNRALNHSNLYLFVRIQRKNFMVILYFNYFSCLVVK